MALPVVIAPIFAGLLELMVGGWPAVRWAAGIGAVSAVLVGWPLIFWMLDTGRSGPIVRTVTGSIAGAAPFAAALLSGVIGLYMKSSDIDYLGWVLEHGAPIPYFGTIYWPRFGVHLGIGVLCGIATMWLSAAVNRLRNSAA